MYIPGEVLLHVVFEEDLGGAYGPALHLEALQEKAAVVEAHINVLVIVEGKALESMLHVMIN